MAKPSKIVRGDGVVIIDLTGDTIKPQHLLKGYTAHGADGEKLTGTCEFDANTQDATAADSEILKGKTVYVKGTKKTGTMPNNGGVSGTIKSVYDTYNVPQGYHDGSGQVALPSTERDKIIPENIRQGVTILGVLGEMSGAEDVLSQSKSVTPSWEAQDVLPDSGFTHLSQVTVGAISYVESENTAGGITVTIG